MMKRHTTLLALGALLLSSLVLSGCHGTKGLNPFEMPESFDETKNYEITFWAKNDTNLTQVAIYNEAVSDFEKLYPNIKVNMRLYTDYARIYNDVITNISTNTTPNVCITYPDHIATYLTGTNVVVPLDGLFVNEKYGFAGSEVRFDAPSFEEIIPEFLNECKLNDSHYAVPYMRSTEAVYINKNFVEDLGYHIPDKLTWDFIWEVSEAATKKDSSGNYIINGQKVMIPFIYKSTDNMMIQMTKQLNSGYSDNNGNIEIFNEKTKALLSDIASHAKSGAFSTFKISSYPANFLNAGQCIFAIDSTAGATWMGASAPNIDISEDALTDFEMVIKPIPQFDINNPQMISQGPSICIFNKEDPGEVLASWLFVQYMLTDKVQTAYAMTEGYVPVTSKAQASEIYTNYLSKSDINSDIYYAPKIEASKLLMDNTGNTFITPVFNGSASLRDAAGQMIENVTKAEQRGTNVDDSFIEKLYSDMTSLYHLDEVKKADTGVSEASDLGPLPVTARVLLVALAFTWAIIASVCLMNLVKSKNGKK